MGFEHVHKVFLFTPSQKQHIVRQPPRQVKIPVVSYIQYFLNLQPSVTKDFISFIFGTSIYSLSLDSKFYLVIKSY